MFIRYLISKYYYKISDIDFVIAAYYDRKVYDFFIKFNKLKLLFIKEKHTKKLWVSIVYYYLIMFAALILYAPITWFLLKVLTDPQNWMIYYLDHINLALAL